MAGSGRVSRPLIPSGASRHLPLVTKGSLFDGSVDVFAHAPKITVDFVIRNTQNTKAILLQKSSPHSILYLVCIFIVLRTVQFNDQLGFGAIEIHDIPSQHLLAHEPVRMVAEKIIPQVPFLLGHAFSKLLGQGYKLLVMLGLHRMSSFDAAPKAPLCKGSWLAKRV